MVENWLEAEDNRAVSSKIGKAKGGIKTGDPPAKRISPGSGLGSDYGIDGRPVSTSGKERIIDFTDSKELGKSERDCRSAYDCKELRSRDELYTNAKRHSICSNYEDDFEDDDLDDNRNDLNTRNKNRFK